MVATLIRRQLGITRSDAGQASPRADLSRRRGFRFDYHVDIKWALRGVLLGGQLRFIVTKGRGGN